MERGLQLWQQLPEEWRGLDATAVLELAEPRSRQELDTLLEVLQPSKLGSSFISAASRVDPNRMANWVSQHSSGEDRSGLLHTVVRHWAAIDPRAAAQWVEAVPAETITTFPILAEIWLGYEEDEASRWIASLPPSPARDGAVEVLLTRLIAKDPEASWSWALSIQTEVRGFRLTQAMETWWQRDAAAAQSALEAAGMTLEQLGLSDLASP